MRLMLFKIFFKTILEYLKCKVNINIQSEYILKGIDKLTSQKELFNLRSSKFRISRLISSNHLRKIISKYLFEILHKEKDMNLA